MSLTALSRSHVQKPERILPSGDGEPIAFGVTSNSDARPLGPSTLADQFGRLPRVRYSNRTHNIVVFGKHVVDRCEHFAVRRERQQTNPAGPQDFIKVLG